MLARMAKYGDGTVASTTSSLQWLRRAADLGNAQAMFLLSNAYEHGEGVNADPALAREWLEKAADGEYPPAVHQLALLLETDQKPEERERARLLRKEATDERHLRWKNYQ
jgi:TPR repeat protein